MPIDTSYDVIVVHIREIPYPDGLGTEVKILFPEELEEQIEDVDEFMEKLREEWKCIFSEQALSFDYIEVYKRPQQEEEDE